MKPALVDGGRPKCATPTSKTNILCGSGDGAFPVAIDFESVIAGRTCPPVSLRNFLDYTKYVTLESENLQFYLWILDYERRFKNLPRASGILSPEIEDGVRKPPLPRKPPVPITAVDGTPIGIDSPLSDDKSMISNMSAQDHSLAPDSYSKMMRQSVISSPRIGNNPDTLSKAEANLQPFREEVAHIVVLYIVENGPRQLNLTGRDRMSILKAMQNTTHPSAFAPAKKWVELNLKRDAYPRFLRWATGNGNRPRILFARALGAVFIALGLVVGLTLTLSHVSRFWRIFVFPLGVFGIATLSAARKSLCVVLHGLHHQQVLPWELFQDDSEGEFEVNGFHTALHPGSQRYRVGQEPWRVRYAQRNLLRKIFDREVWVEDPLVRAAQDKVVTHAVVIGILVSTIVTAAFVLMPQGSYF